MFSTDLEAGKNAEHIFWKFYGQISGCNILSPQRQEKENAEGKDIKAIAITEDGLENWNTEVKALLSNTFIKRNNNNYLKCGTLEIELWSNAWDENNRLIPRDRWKPGWFMGMIHNDEINEYRMTHGYDTLVTIPNQLAFMLCKDNLGKQPYACVLFPEFNKLKERLYQIAPFDLDDLVPPTHFRDYWNNPKLNTPFNCWYVALDDIVDLARIVLFEDVAVEPDLNWPCPPEVQRARCEYLIQHACFSFNRATEELRMQNAGRAYNRDCGLPDSAKIPHMTAFDTSRLPSYVKQYPYNPDWLEGIV